jgi:hypothetical protein
MTINWGTGFDVHIHGIHFKYSNYEEICQGGPRMGNLTINDYVSRIVCCGPFIYTDDYIYVSVKMSSPYSVYFSGKGIFCVCRLHIFDNCRMEYIGMPGNYMELVSLNGNRLFYHDKIDSENMRYVDLNDLIKSSETDTPLNFNLTVTVNNFTVEYINPEKKTSANLPAGQLKVNEYLFHEHQFGGPFLYNESFLVIPVFKQKMWKAGFNIAIIDLLNYRIHIFPCLKKMIFLERFINNTVYYYDDIDKTSLRNYSF